MSTETEFLTHQPIPFADVMYGWSLNKYWSLRDTNRWKTCSCPFVWYFLTSFWVDITIIWDEDIVYFFNWKKNKLFWTNKKFVYLILINKLSWYHPKILYENIVQKNMSKFEKKYEKSFHSWFFFLHSASHRGHNEYTNSGWIRTWKKLCAKIYSRIDWTSYWSQKKISRSGFGFWICPIYAIFCLCWLHVLRRLLS